MSENAVYSIGNEVSHSVIALEATRFHPVNNKLSCQGVDKSFTCRESLDASPQGAGLSTERSPLGIVYYFHSSHRLLGITRTRKMIPAGNVNRYNCSV